MMVKTRKKTDKFRNIVLEVVLPDGVNVKKSASELVHLSRSLAEKQRWPDIIELMRQVTERAPGYTEAWAYLLDACHRAGEFSLLYANADKYLALKPRFIPALVARGTALRFMQQPEKAMQDLLKAQKLKPTDVSVLNQLGILQKELGLNRDALSTFNRCVAIRPDYSIAYWNRSDLLSEPSDEHIEQMTRVLHTHSVTANQRARLHYALARAFEYRKDYEKQFHHVRLGAEEKRSSVNYSATAELKEMQAIPRYFTPSVLRQQARANTSASTPIFICGLPRSGTTLVEQILSSHPDVDAGDEINAFPTAVAQCLGRLRINKSYPEWVADLDKHAWQMVGDVYLSQTRWLQKKLFFTDKNLQNYRAIGLIHLALPQAKIIYCRRNPMDNLWACYRQFFGDGQLYTYDQKELAHIWKAADSAIDHWVETLGHKVFVLDYEKLVEEQEALTRQLLDFVGLGWDERCLRFYENDRAVRTISSVQIRNPMSKSRIGQWKRYERWLGDMKSLVGDVDS